MGLFLAAAVLGAVAWLLWMWLVRARQVALASAEVRRGIERDRARAGALPSAAIEVASAAVIEPRVEREPCPWCGGAVHVDQHTVEEHAGDRVRRIEARCGRCGRPTTTWFRLRMRPPH